MLNIQIHTHTHTHTGTHKGTHKGTHQLDVCELLGHGEGVAADAEDVALHRLRLGLEHSQPVRRRGADLGQRLLVLAECGQLPDQPLGHLLHGLTIQLPETEREREGGRERENNISNLCTDDAWLRRIITQGERVLSPEKPLL